MRADGLRRLVGTQREQFVAQGQEATWLETNDRHATRGERRKGRNQPIELGADVIDEAGGQESAAATERLAAAQRLGNMHAIATRDQHAKGCIEIFALKSAVEGICEQHDLAATLGAEQFGFRREHVAAPLWQASFGADPGETLEERTQEPAFVAPIGDWRKPGGERRISR